MREDKRKQKTSLTMMMRGREYALGIKKVLKQGLQLVF